MSWDAMQAMRKRSRAEGQVKAVGVALASYARKGSNLAWPSNEKLMTDGFSKRKVQYALRELERLGEIKRRLDLETYERRRVYEIDLDGSAQMSIFDPSETPDRMHSVHPVDPEPGAPQVSPGAGHARPCKERKGTVNYTPQPPNELGGTSPDLFIEQTYRTSRGRRRQRTVRVDVASVASTLEVPAPVDVDDWQRIRVLLASAVGESQFDVWLSGLELVAVDANDKLLLSRPRLASWATDRFGRVMASCAADVGRQVAIASEAQTVAIDSRSPQVQSAQPSR